MNLLLKTVEEYLKEHHPNWTISSYKYNNQNIIDIIDPHHPTLLIVLNTENQTITTIEADTEHTAIHTYHHYNLLQQITKTINTLKQP